MNLVSQPSWHEILVQLQQRSEMFRSWMYELDLPGLAGGVLSVQARNEAQNNHLVRCRSVLAGCAQSVLGRLVSVEVEFDPSQRQVQPAAVEPDTLRADFQLDNFVVADENRMAFAALQRALLRHEPFLGLIFLHGPIGSGKSHLLQGYCREQRDRDPPSAGVYVSACGFIGGLTASFDGGFSQDYVDRLVAADVLALDDVEGFEGKKKSQEAFFHVLNARASADRQTLIAASRTPTALIGLEPRLISRFSAGLVIGVDAPGLETRLRILQQKNHAQCFGFPQPVLERLAERGSGKDLDDILARLDGLAHEHGGPATMDLVDDVFRTPRVCVVA